MADLHLKDVKKSFGSVKVIRPLDLDIKSGELVVFVGPSGCGKSTLLRIIAGLEQVSAGQVIIDDHDVTDLQPAERGIAMVFQSYALYPHMTVYKNIAFGLKIAGTPKDELDQRVRAAAEMLQLTPYLDRLPKDLSGGQRQRVAIGRAISRNPKIFLFDEPLSNLDAALRAATRVEIARLKESLPQSTMVYVTHDQVEAMTLADRIVVLNAGRIEQVGSPLELYKTPRTQFVAQFIGSPAMNIFDGEVAANGQVQLTDGVVNVGIGNPLPLDTKVRLGIRPEDMYLTENDDALFDAEVDYVEHLGDVTIIYAKLASGQKLTLKCPGIMVVSQSQTIHVGARKESLHVFDAEGFRIQ